MSEKKREKSLVLPNSQLVAQLERLGDFYTKRLNLIIKFSDCSFIYLFRIFCLMPSSTLGFFFTLYAGSVSLRIWKAIIAHRLAFGLLYLSQDKINIGFLSI